MGPQTVCAHLPIPVYRSFTVLSNIYQYQLIHAYRLTSTSGTIPYYTILPVYSTIDYDRLETTDSIRTMAPARAAANKKRRRTQYGCADAVTSLLDTFIKAEQQAATTPSTAKRTAKTTATTTTSTVLTPSAVQAMMICHERFLQVMAAELAVEEEEEEAGLSKVQPTQVLSALQQLGWESLVPPALPPTQRRPVAVEGGKRKRKKGKHEFSVDMLAEQERLLAASKTKALGGKMEG
jgi:hypothetical protein